MVSAVSSSNQIQPAAQSAQAVQKPAQPKPQAAAKDTVQISKAGQSALQAAIQEATETQAQTAQEARSGDQQAQRLLARENAAGATEK